MKLKVCEYCGTEYNEEQDRCPLCGKDVKEAQAAAAKEKNTGSRRNPDRIPQWMWVLTCGLLALAVVIGLFYFLVSMGYVGKKQTTPPPAISVPVEDPVPVVPVVEEPVDLSCKELTLSHRVLILDEAGSHVFLTALPAPVDCEDPVLFSSSDETIAEVDDDGMITALAPGETEILVSCGDILETCTVICDFEAEDPQEETPEETEDPEENDTPTESDPADDPTAPQEPEKPEETTPQADPELSSVDFTLFHPGEETTLFVKNAPEGAGITYTSSDPSVATVSETGKVVAVGDGTAIITVTINDKTLTCFARCNLDQTTENNPDNSTVELPAGGSYHLSHVDVTLAEGSNESFTLLLLDESGNKVSGATFSTSDASVCVAEASGRVTAIGSGTANITVSYGGKTYTCVVR